MKTTANRPSSEPIVPFVVSGAAPTARENEDSLRDGRESLQAPDAPAHFSQAEGVVAPRSSARVHLVLGPVGAGKSTFALAVARDARAVRFNLDQWMTELFSPDRPAEGRVAWYVERTARCLERIWAVALDVVERGTAVVLELGLLSRREREAFYERIDGAGLGVTVYVLDASRDVRRQRVMKRNEARDGTFCMVVPPEFFELASDLWEPLQAAECAGRDVRFVRTDP